MQEPGTHGHGLSNGLSFCGLNTEHWCQLRCNANSFCTSQLAFDKILPTIRLLALEPTSHQEPCALTAAVRLLHG